MTRPQKAALALGVGMVFLAAACRPQADVSFDFPQERQVLQRDDAGGADVRVEGIVSGSIDFLEVRARPADADPTPWTPPEIHEESPGRRRFRAIIRLPSGGWHRLEWRSPRNLSPTQGIARLGVGEVFIVAGQSNSTNCGDPSTPVYNDMVSAFDGERWHLARDPMPGVQDGSDGGSPWPRFGDLLQRSLGVPVAIASVGHGDSSVLDWRPDAPPREDGIGKALYPALRQRLSALGRVRAILWHQGETDARERISGEAYVEAFLRLQRGLGEDTGEDPTWVVANASFLSQNSEASMSEIRAAQRRLWETGLALQGPDTDDLRGPLRARDHTHFSRSGLSVHAERWFAMVWSQLFSDAHGARAPTAP